MFRSKPPFSSELFDQRSFYGAFAADLRNAKTRVVIESPFITMKRLNSLWPTIKELNLRGVKILINTKPFDEHDPAMREQAEKAVAALQSLGVKVLMTFGHHRKLAVIDDIVWEGSLNILSQHDSCEFMRRIESRESAQELIGFIGAQKWL